MRRARDLLGSLFSCSPLDLTFSKVGPASGGNIMSKITVPPTWAVFKVHMPKGHLSPRKSRSSSNCQCMLDLLAAVLLQQRPMTDHHLSQ